MPKIKTKKDIFKKMEEDKPVVSTQKIKVISSLAEKQVMFEKKYDEDDPKVLTFFELAKKDNLSIPFLEAVIKNMNKEYQQIRTDHLPDIMTQVGMESFTLSGGAKVEIKKDVSCNVKNPDALNKHITKKGHGDIIKSTVTVHYGKGDKKKSAALQKHLKELSADFSSKDTIHAQTLKKHVKEQMAEGKKFPGNIINIFEYKYAKIS